MIHPSSIQFILETTLRTPYSSGVPTIVYESVYTVSNSDKGSKKRRRYKQLDVDHHAHVSVSEISKSTYAIHSLWAFIFLTKFYIPSCARYVPMGDKGNGEVVSKP